MLRTLLVLLLGCNVLVFAWARGWLEPMFIAPAHVEREPARLAGQVNPDAVRLLAPTAASAAVGAARQAAAVRCVEAGPFGVVDAAAAVAAMESANLPAGSWERDVRGPAQVWLRVPAADAALRAQLQALATNSTLLSGGFKACGAGP
jgi:hypothetical protein